MLDYSRLPRQIASSRGLNGISPVIQDAIEYYLAYHSESEEALLVERALEMKGCVSDEEGSSLHNASSELRARWR